MPVSFTELNNKFDLKNQATLNMKIKEVLNKLGLITENY